MTIRRVAVLLAVAVLVTRHPASAEPIDGTMLPLPAPDGWVMTPDGVTLIVSQGEKGQLVYFDTVAEREVKRVDVDFKPGPMAIQGGTLFVGAKGSSVVHALDAKTGAFQKEIVLGGDAVVNLACHPTKGLVYASTTTYKVYAIDPAAGTATKTKATGSFLAVDPVNAAALFTGVQPPRDFDEVIVEDLPDGRVKIYFDRWGARAFLLKYEVRGTDLKLVSSQKNAAAGGHGLVVTPDGKKVMMLGGAWRPPVEGGTGGGQPVAFSAENLATMLGEAPGGTNVAFHPVLNLGVANREGRAIQLFNPKSLVLGPQYDVAKGADGRAVLVTFGGKGTKVVLWNGDNPRNPQEGLHFLTLPMTPTDRAAVEKVYGKLPPLPPVAVVPTPVKKTDPKGTTPDLTKKTDPGASPELTKVPPGGVIAAAGFNMKKGLGTTPGGAPPYPVGSGNALGGFGERGWRGVWPAGNNAEFVADPVFEGDGALKLTGTVGYARDFARDLTGQFTIEAVVRVPRGGGGKCYVQNTTAEDTAAMWSIGGGKLSVLNGKGDGGGDNWEAVADFPADTWQKVAVVLDMAAGKWAIELDGKRIPKQFGFRGRPASVHRVSYLVEGSSVMYLDAIRVLAGGAVTAPAPGKTGPPPKAGGPGASPDLTKKAAPDLAPVPPGGVIAATGFNEKTGLGTDGGAAPPYPVGTANAPGGFGERGWSGAWPANRNGTFVADPVFEGDGALKLTGLAQCGRGWARPQTGKFTVEARVRVPAGDGGACYVWESNHTNTGPMWRVAGGTLKAMDGNGHGDGKWLDVAPFRPDEWHKVAAVIDVPAKTWALELDGKPVRAGLNFRGRPAALREVNYLVEGKAVMYVDALRVIAGGP